MTIEEIKSLMKSGDVAGAEAAAQELLTAEPDNVQAMMLYGTCRQLQGDEATFRRIHDELAPRMSSSSDANVLTMWQTYCNEYVKIQRPRLVQSFDYAQAGACLMEYVIAGGLIVIAIGVAIYYFGRTTYSLYAAPGQMEAVTGIEGKSVPNTLNNEEIDKGSGLTPQKTLCEGCGGRGKGR